MPRLRAVWATIELVLAVAAAAWGAYILISTREAGWAGGNFAAAVFILVAAYLFGRDHPDDRVVAAFGAAIFFATNAILVYQRLSDAGVFGRVVVGNGTFGPGNLDQANVMFAWLVGGVMLLIGIPQLLLVLFGHRPPRPAPDPWSEMPPQGS